MKSIVAQRLRFARENKNLTQVDVYNKTGINNKTLSGYENNVSSPDLETLKTLAKLYECSTDYLLGYSPVPSDIYKSERFMQIENSPLGVSLLEEEFIKRLAETKGYSSYQTEMEIKLILWLGLINFYGFEDLREQGQWNMIEKIKEEMLSNKESLNDNISKVFFLELLNELKNKKGSYRDWAPVIQRIRELTLSDPSLLFVLEQAQYQELSEMLDLDIKKYKNKHLFEHRQTIVNMPVYGNVIAGLDGPVVDDFLGTEPWIVKVGFNKNCYMLKVKDESMFPRFFTGDFAVICPQDDVANGDIAVAVIDKEKGVLRRIKKVPNGIILRADNHLFPDREFFDKDRAKVKIAGRVIDVKMGRL